jgi:Leucine-rich repeat (LRR) protein
MYKTVDVALLLLSAAILVAQNPTPVTQTEAGKKALEKIRQSGALALEIAQNDNHLEISFAQAADKLNDEQLSLLKDLQGLVHLDLRGLPIGDAQLAHLKDLTSLTRLHLEKTKVTDKGLENLKGLVNLEYLNLYGTEVTDKGLENLEGMKKLKNLYLWQTKVTDAGAAKLKKAINGVDINRGFEEKPPEKKEPAKDKEKEKKDSPKDKDKEKEKKK